MRGKVAKKLRRDAREVVEQGTPYRKGMYSDCSMVRIHDPHIPNKDTTYVLYECERVVYRIFKRVYKRHF